ncbi:MAG: J domain-containing protein, partial [Candidatus Limnocylindrales bacterium]
MPKRDPYQVLGVSHDASQATIKAAWRRLAREHHPDLVGDDASAARRATREMAQINAAYQDIRDPERRQAWRDTAGSHTAPPTATTRPRSHPGGGFEQAARASGPPRPRERPITARLDTTELFRPRNQTLDPRPTSPLPGWEPRPRQAFQREAPRASDPTGPSQRRRGRVIRPVLPALE